MAPKKNPNSTLESSKVRHCKLLEGEDVEGNNSLMDVEESHFGLSDSDLDPDYASETGSEDSEDEHKFTVFVDPCIASLSAGPGPSSSDPECSAAYPEQNGCGPIPPLQVDSLGIRWVENKPDLKPIAFTGKPGLKVPFPDPKPTEYFKLLFTPPLLEFIVNRINAFAQKLREAASAPRARIRPWKELTVTEFYKFLGLIFLMGHIGAPSIDHYWKRRKPYIFSTFSSVMSRDRFLLILRCLYFSKDQASGDRVEDPFHKIRPLLDFFNYIMDNLYHPEKELCIDEPMVLQRGKLYLLQNIVKNTHNYGIKLYTLSQADGLVLRTLVCTGSKDKEVGGKRHGAKVIRQLVDPILGVGHTIYVDFYNSILLAHELLDKKTYMSGMLRKSREGNPIEVVEATLKKGEVAEKFTDRGVSVFKWRHKRDNIFISSEFDAHIDTIQIKGKTVEKPVAILKHNKFMSGIDRHDQISSFYPLERKILRWYAKLAIHVFHIMMNNSYRLFLKNAGIKMTLLDFREQVIAELLGIDLTTGAIPPPPLVRGVHLPKYLARVDRKRCRLCYKAHKRQDTRYICKQCPDEPGLCLDPCFGIFHNYVEHM